MKHDVRYSMAQGDQLVSRMEIAKPVKNPYKMAA